MPAMNGREEGEGDARQEERGSKEVGSAESEGGVWVGETERERERERETTMCA